MKKWECQSCGYVYDPNIRDRKNGSNSKIPFSLLPKDWVCPVCGACKESFEELVIIDTEDKKNAAD
ncbi:rubredoxin [Fusobacterium sp. MFO224]|uniref:rubredoxin n=1 Tax=Fusobacterium sp. MFO224 TaxID=3378070 RepID=UPI003854842D